MSILLTILLFTIVLGVLIFSHELGHFLVAKYHGIRVDEFGFGFPPRILGKKIGETLYSINWIPFGGFVRIFGEDNQEAFTDQEKKKSFVHKSKLAQVSVLAAGVVFNIVLAWILISASVGVGFLASQSIVGEAYLNDPHLTISAVLPESPASRAGLLFGDKVEFLKIGEVTFTELNEDNFSNILNGSKGETVTIGLVSMDSLDLHEVVLTPEKGLLEDENKYGIGVGLDTIGTYRVPYYLTPIEGAVLTWDITKATAVGYVTIIGDIFKGQGREVLDVVSGPVGIAGLVGSAAEAGFVNLLMLTAIISISLAIINLIPFPALDGGRILFVIIEKMKGSPVKPKVTNIINTAGFFILIALLLIVTYNDIVKLVVG